MTDMVARQSWHRFASPARFQRLARAVLPWCWGLCLPLLALGAFLGLFHSPADYQQGETVRIMYVHVPAAWMAMAGWALMALGAAFGLVWRHAVGLHLARAAAPVGAGFTLVCLVTGALWGKPMWGAPWVWDARLTSVLILFFLYLGYMALVNGFDDAERGLKAGAVLALVGLVNLPIIKFSVDWWNTLHQPASVVRMGGPSIAGPMLAPLLVMGLAFLFLFTALVLRRTVTELEARRLAVRQMRAAERGA